MTQNTPRSSVTSRTIAVEHIRVSSGRPFSQVRQKLEATLPKLDTSIAEALGSGDQKRAKDYEENGPKLPIFVERDRDALLQIAGKKRHAMPLFFAARFEYDPTGQRINIDTLTMHRAACRGCLAIASRTLHPAEVRALTEPGLAAAFQATSTQSQRR
jgi:hypothetical protein